MHNKEAKKEKVYDEKRSWNYALWLLGRQGYSKKQLADKLKKKAAPPEVIEAVVAKLERLRFIDDALYAESYIRSRQNKKGPQALNQELRLKGISEDIIEEKLAHLHEDAQLETAMSLLQKNAWRFRGENQRKAYAFLAHRGFSSDAVREAIERVHNEALDED